MTYDMRSDIVYDGTTENWPISVGSSEKISQEQWDEIFSDKERKRYEEKRKKRDE